MGITGIGIRFNLSESLQIFGALEQILRNNLNAEDVLMCEGTLEEHSLAEKQLHYGTQRFQQTCKVVEILIEQNDWGQA